MDATPESFALLCKRKPSTKVEDSPRSVVVVQPPLPALDDANFEDFLSFLDNVPLLRSTIAVINKVERVEQKKKQESTLVATTVAAQTKEPTASTAATHEEFHCRRRFIDVQTEAACRFKSKDKTSKLVQLFYKRHGRSSISRPHFCQLMYELEYKQDIFTILKRGKYFTYFSCVHSHISLAAEFFNQ